MEKVVVAFGSERTCHRVRDILEAEGLAMCILCRSAAEVKRVVAKQNISTVICGFKLFDGSASGLYEDLPGNCTMLLVARQDQLDLCGGEIFKLPAPASRGDLIGSVEMLLDPYRTSRPAAPRRSGEEEEAIGAAKAVLMDRNGMSEEEAHRFLQKQSMDRCVRLTDMARMVLSGN